MMYLKEDRVETFDLKKGKRYDLDKLYTIMGIIPEDTYEQDDPFYSDIDGNDSGESILMTANVKIEISVKVKH